jgi:hypothetical protein
MKNTNIANIRTTTKGLFEHWVALTQPLHKLTDAEAVILVAFLRKRYIYSSNVKDDDIVDKLLFSTDTRKEVMNELGYKMGTFQNYLTSMRVKGVINENKINKKLIPNFESGSDNFKLIFNFLINNG